MGPTEGYEAVKDAVGHRAEVLRIEPEPQALADALGSADGLIDASMRVRITDRMIHAARNLKVISCATTGSDHIERGQALARKIPILTLRDDPEFLRNITPAAELSWALLMACARQLIPATAHVRAGGWQREKFPGVMLRGKTIGIIGCGRIGQWMARYAAAFGMDVLGCDPFLEDWPDFIHQTPLETLVAQAHFITVHVHLSEETRGLMSRELFRQVRHGAIFVNTSRGTVTDEDALLDALQSGRLAAAGLDVLDGEPDIENHPLVEYARNNDNLVITPHCGGFSPDAVRLVCGHAVQKLLEHID